ncbi:uncharacterized protein SRS1_12305 [Sporisorium reilianum f. sp. reilianum]|uniref:Uncharacterized protein n=1 Tax=Sporisorium reilianum f. sp. reilianum TaxID=72559 RepID=A0A2N8U9X3_9BASI|nr:uncharacterized protein SRS1_12305 [Sporisorium reilianum f. sp. reilianum]
MTSFSAPAPALSAIKIDITPIPTTSPVLPTKRLTTPINSIPTHIIAQSFADRIFITVTQLNKFGCLYQATTSASPSALDHDPVEASGSDLPPPLASTSVSKLVGSEPSPAYTALYQLYVAQIASIVKRGAGGDARPIIVSLALKPSEGKGSAEGDWDDEGDLLLLTSEDERTRFIAVMEAVQKCRVW